MSRYVVTEVEGFADTMKLRRGISVQVIDTAICHRVMKTWRSEDYRSAAGMSSRAQVRKRARLYCDGLNGVVPKMPKGSNTCPECGGPKSWVSVRCMMCRVQEEQHGKNSTYTVRGCRCALCKAAHAAYQRKWKTG